MKQGNVLDPNIPHRHIGNDGIYTVEFLDSYRVPDETGRGHSSSRKT